MSIPSTKVPFSGTGVALITPFLTNGSIDYPALGRIMDHTREGGVSYYVVLGTTGEPATLTAEEKVEVFRFAAHHNQGRIPLVAGVGGNHTAELIEQINRLPLEDYQAILSVSPYYNKPSQEGIYAHYRALNDRSRLPILLYNVPSRTGSNIEAETTLRIAERCEKVIGIKEASGNFEQMTAILRNKPGSFVFISGDDGLAVPMMSIGATGLISVLANAYPKETVAMVDSALTGNFSEAGKAHRRLSAMISLLFKESSPTGVKSMCALLGLSNTTVRLPLVAGSKKIMKEIQDQLQLIQLETAEK